MIRSKASSDSHSYIIRRPPPYGLLLTLLLLGWVGIVCPFTRASGIVLKDMTQETGITFRHCDGSSGLYRIGESVASGLALLDYDNDGDVDIYFISGAYAEGVKNENVPRNTLYRNDGQWRFTDVTAQADVGDLGFGLGVAVADYDNDGDQDIYVNNWGPNTLYRNNGNGTFTDVTQVAGVANGSQMGAGANFLDMDKDGDLDLFVSSYSVYSLEKHIPSTVNGFPVYPGPGLYDHTFDALFRNNGDGTFTDVSQASGVAFARSPGMGSVCADYDHDGDTDIFVANDARPNYLFQNDGTGHFEEVGLLAGIAYDLHGQTQGSMGMDLGDYDNDGWLDLYVTSYQNEWASLLRNQGGGFFADVTLASGAGVGTVPNVTWGIGFVDFDNDGLRDLFLACGHVQDKVEHFDDRSTYYQKNILYRNLGNGKFEDVSTLSGDGLQVQLASRGVGFDDLDNDGDVDGVILNSRREPTLLRNDSPAPGHWLQVTLRGTRSNRDGVGAQVRIVTPEATFMDEVHSGRSYQSDFGKRLYFGLGEQTTIDRVEVAWIGGTKETFTVDKVDRHVVLVEGQGSPRQPKTRE